MNRPEDSAMPWRDFMQSSIIEQQFLQDRTMSLARQENNLARLMQRLDVDEVNARKPEFSFLIEPDSQSLGLEDIFAGVGDPSVTFWNYLKGGRERFFKRLGVYSPFRLTLGICTDVQLREVLKQHMSVNMPGVGVTEDMGFNDYIETNYFVDTTGNYAKVLGLPNEVETDRSNVVLEDGEVNGMKFVEATMTPKDIVFMQRALTVMHTRVYDFLSGK